MHTSWKILLALAAVTATQSLEARAARSAMAAGPSVHTDFPAGQLGQSEWIAPGHLRAVLYREWDESHSNTQATWYYFRLDGVRDKPLVIELTGLDDVYNGRPSHSIADRDKPFVSEDNVRWQRLLTTEFDVKRSTLTIRITPKTDRIWIAHLEPYTEEHLRRLASDFRGNRSLRIESAGRTVEGRDLPLWTITDPTVPDSGKRVVWWMGRQHPWETHTSWCLEGVVRFLLADTPEAARLRRQLVCRLLPMMDPDGVARGATRFNRHGYDVNRHWNEVQPDDPEVAKKMPEIAAAKRAIREWLAAGRRIDLFLAFHDTQVDSLSMAPGDYPALLKLHELMRGFRFSGKAFGVSFPSKASTVEVALHQEFGFPAGLIELGTVDLPTYGRYVTAPDRVQFGADLVAAVGHVFSAENHATVGQAPVAPGKFIPTYAVKYGGTQGWPPLEEAARFDLLDVSAGTAHARVYANSEGNTWQRLKRLNPHLVVIQYELGPGEYNVASWGGLGDGWEWITRHHGIGSADRWTAVGAQYGEYLEAVPYGNERLMLIGNPNWQRYWLEAVYAKLWTKAGADGIGVDGLFADNTRYQMIWQGRWLREGHRDQPDVPADYYRNGKHLPDLWKTGTQQFLALATPWLAERSRKLVLNYADIVSHPDDWADLDAQPQPVFAAMDEGSFVHPWGRPDRFNYRTEEQWLLQVRTMRSLKHVRALMNIHGNVRSQAQDITRMDATDAEGNRAWDVFWYALTSFLQGYDDIRQNAYLNFTVWGYSRFYWFKEFDPRHLHLGRARGEMQRVEGEQGHVYLREFEAGWVATNPTRANSRGVKVPAGKARILTHDNFEQAEAQPLVERFDLPSHRGVVLLKEGQRCGQR